MSYSDSLKSEIDERVPDLIAVRRDLHRHPELAFEEVRTAGIVVRRLQALDIEVQTDIAQTGVTGLLRGGQREPGAKTIAIRADMDALPIQEQNDVSYRSVSDGKMHACGHDGHISILLTVAEVLSKRRDELKGSVKFIFQPAEENMGGAKPMLAQGAMQDVDGVIGLHLISHYPLGRVGVRAGVVFASVDAFVLIVKGQGNHAAMFDRAIDPVVIAAHITTALQTLVSRETSPLEPAVITVAMIQAGTGFNIIPETAIMKGTMRSYSAEHRRFLLQRIREMASGIASSMGGSCDVKIVEGIPPCVNDPEMTLLVHNAAVATVGEQNVDNGNVILTMGSDDMSVFLQAVPGCYFIVGTKNAEKEADYPHHHPRFNIDEEALPIAVEVLTRAALDFLS